MQSCISGNADAAACGSDILRLPRWRGEGSEKGQVVVREFESWRERSERFDSQNDKLCREKGK
jgi:hypothetical protein